MRPSRHRQALPRRLVEGAIRLLRHHIHRGGRVKARHREGDVAAVVGGISHPEREEVQLTRLDVACLWLALDQHRGRPVVSHTRQQLERRCLVVTSDADVVPAVDVGAGASSGGLDGDDVVVQCVRLPGVVRRSLGRAWVSDGNVHVRVAAKGGKREHDGPAEVCGGEHEVLVLVGLHVVT